jgi:hypothetical protein
MWEVIHHAINNFSLEMVAKDIAHGTLAHNNKKKNWQKALPHKELRKKFRQWAVRIHGEEALTNTGNGNGICTVIFIDPCAACQAIVKMRKNQANQANQKEQRKDSEIRTESTKNFVAEEKKRKIKKDLKEQKVLINQAKELDKYNNLNYIEVVKAKKIIAAQQQNASSAQNTGLDLGEKQIDTKRNNIVLKNPENQE